MEHRSGERGQAVVIVALAIAVMCGMGAISVDVAAWYAKRHTAQLAADAAALAAAQCLGNGAAGQTCTSTTDTTDAANVAVAYAARNGVNIPTSDVTISGSTITVTTPNPTPPTFARAVGIGTVTPTALAAADWTKSSGFSTCTASLQSAGSCGAIFAGGGCSAGVTGSSISGTINGGIISDGDLTLSSVSGTVKGPVDYGPGCTESLSSISGSVPTPQQLSSTLPYPEQWGGSTPNETTPSCTVSTSNPQTITSGTTTITVTSSNITITGASPIPAGVYCAPSGTISISSYSGGAAYVTLIAQTVSFSSIAGGPFSPCTSANNASCPSSNLLMIWQTGSSALSLSSISGAVNGTVYAPSATITTGSLSGSTGFIEGNAVDISSISGYIGAGPAYTSSGGGAATVALIQ